MLIKSEGIRKIAGSTINKVIPTGTTKGSVAYFSDKQFSPSEKTFPFAALKVSLRKGAKNRANTVIHNVVLYLQANIGAFLILFRETLD